MYERFRAVLLLTTFIASIHGPIATVSAAPTGEIEQGEMSLSLRAKCSWAQHRGMANLNGPSGPNQGRQEDQPGESGAVRDSDADEIAGLAKAAQNPVADLISLPFQFNTQFQMGDHGRASNVLNIQPVVPIDLSDEWLLITRTILPVIYRPAMFTGDSDEFGVGDLQFTGWFSPKNDSGFIWGVGPVLRFPTASDDTLGSEKWSAGASFVALIMEGPWVAGGLVQNVWSYAGDSDRSQVNEFLLQPFVNYNLEEGWYLTSSPIITANWDRDSSDQWLIPVGGGFGRVFRIGKQAVNVSVQGFYHAAKPSEGPDWSTRVQFQLMFPKAKG